jgi:CDGSH-type Zn-finger protein
MSTIEIEVRDNGPYRLRGPVTIKDADGNTWEFGDEVIALCRCGQSARKPFCDATHRTCGFENAPRAAPAGS